MSLELKRDREWAVPIVNQDGEAFPATTYACEVREFEQLSSRLLLTPTVDTSQAASGTLTLRATNTETAAIPAGVIKGFLDVYRGSTKTPVFDATLEVNIVEGITA